MFEILRAGDGAWYTLVNKNEILEGTRKVAIEAIWSRPSPSRGPRFTRNNERYKKCSGYWSGSRTTFSNAIGPAVPAPEGGWDCQLYIYIGLYVGGAVAACLGSGADGTGSNPASLYFHFCLAPFFWKISKYFCRIYSVGKGRLAAGSIATAIKKIGVHTCLAAIVANTSLPQNFRSWLHAWFFEIAS